MNFSKENLRRGCNFQGRTGPRQTKGGVAGVVYYVDEISDDVRQLLERLSQKYGVAVEVKLNSQFLHGR